MKAEPRTSRIPARQQMRARVNALVQQRIGVGCICSRCGATLGSYADRCAADLDERCPGANAIELETRRAEQEVGMRR
jgi:ribosomal protein L40E